MKVVNKLKEYFINTSIENIEKHLSDLTYDCSICVLSMGTYKQYYEYFKAVKDTNININGLNEFASELLRAEVIRYFEDEEIEYIIMQQELAEYVSSLEGQSR